MQLCAAAHARTYTIMTTKTLAAPKAPRRNRICDCACGLRYVRREQKPRKHGGAAQCECGLVLAAWGGGEAHYVFVPAERGSASFRIH